MLSTTSGPVQTFIFDTETASSPIPEDFKLGYLVRPVDICVIHTAPMSQASEHHSTWPCSPLCSPHVHVAYHRHAYRTRTS